MAKTGFWLRGAKGKLAGSVLYQANGSTIQREIVTPNNPQSENQMRQRIGFAAASKFYQQAQQNRFVLAFPNKATNQSTFNAWMSQNLRQKETLIYPTKEQVNNPNFCAFYPWVCSTGNLPRLQVKPTDDFTDLIGLNIRIADEDTEEVFSTWEEVIAANPGLDLQYGDIITLTAIVNDMRFDGANVQIGYVPPIWVTRQFKIGDDLGTNTLEEYLEKNDFQSMTSQTGPSDSCGINLAELSNVFENINYGPGLTSQDDALPVMAVATRSRMVNGKLKVSNSEMWCSFMAQQIYTRLSLDSQLYEAIDSYKGVESNAMPTNILEGSEIVTPFSPMRVDYYTDRGEFEQSSAFPVDAQSAGVHIDTQNRKYKWYSLYLKGTGDTIQAGDIQLAAVGSSDISKLSLNVTSAGTAAQWKALDVRVTLTGQVTTGTVIAFAVKFRGQEVFRSNITA